MLGFGFHDSGASEDHATAVQVAERERPRVQAANEVVNPLSGLRPIDRPVIFNQSRRIRGGRLILRRLDGVDLRDIPEADMRRSVAMVTQESFLFSGTIDDNIRFGRPSASPDRASWRTFSDGVPWRPPSSFRA